MNKIVTACVVILTLCALILGNHHWNQKISSVKAQEDPAKSEEMKQEEQPKWQKYAANLSAPLKEKIKEAQEGGAPLKLVAAGSESTSIQSTGWPALLQSKLDAAYGKNIFAIEVLSYPEGTTRTFLNENHMEDISKQKPDILLLEPFSLNDNGNVGLENTLLNLEEILSDIKQTSPEAVIYLQPSHPIFNATFYPKEVGALKEFAEEKDLTYLDHWTNWPDSKDEKIKTMLTEDQQTPNVEGNKVWAEYLASYFIKNEK
ncbi:SGNH/GDSL hydrolase family protein [Metabacillus sp. cB07]|uniref:SGNH/GDSL hydrolase family protein n=1 Tax=Metabacillus sp. cB07 TaxID=2806989 RepID=UPI0019398163|nr:SGNH/GDSL hydrolase family protein [Metabacillus sp. cB07]